MSELVGRRVSIYWDGDDQYFDGTIKEHAISTGKHLVLFDDGDQEWYDLAAETLKWLDEGIVRGSKRAGKQPQAGGWPGKRRCNDGKQAEVNNDEENDDNDDDDDSSLEEEEEQLGPSASTSRLPGRSPGTSPGRSPRKASKPEYVYETAEFQCHHEDDRFDVGSSVLVPPRDPSEDARLATVRSWSAEKAQYDLTLSDGSHKVLVRHSWQVSAAPGTTPIPVYKVGLELSDKIIDGVRYVQVTGCARGSPASEVVAPKRLVLSIDGAKCDRGAVAAMALLRAAESRPDDYLKLELRSVLKRKPPSDPAVEAAAAKAAAAKAAAKAAEKAAEAAASETARVAEAARVAAALPPPPSEAPAWAVACLTLPPADVSEVERSRADSRLIDAVAELATLPAALLTSHADSLASHLSHKHANVRKGCLACLGKLDDACLAPRARALVKKVADDWPPIATLAIDLISRLLPSMREDAAAWAYLHTTLGAIVVRDETAPPLPATSFALDLLFGGAPGTRFPGRCSDGVSTAELARSFDLGRLERALDEDACETKAWRTRQRWEVKEPPRRFLHRAPTWREDGVAWGAVGSGVTLAHVLEPYEEWRAAAQARIEAARLEQLSHVFRLWATDAAVGSSSRHRSADAGSSSCCGGGRGSSSGDSGGASEPAPPCDGNHGLARMADQSAAATLSPAAVESLVSAVSHLPAGTLRPRLGEVLCFVADGTDPELLAPAVQLVLNCDASRLLAHVSEAMRSKPRGPCPNPCPPPLSKARVPCLTDVAPVCFACLLSLPCAPRPVCCTSRCVSSRASLAGCSAPCPRSYASAPKMRSCVSAGRRVLAATTFSPSNSAAQTRC